MKSSERGLCATCRHFQPHPIQGLRDDGMGFCRDRSPVHGMPHAHATGGCGEHVAGAGWPPETRGI